MNKKSLLIAATGCILLGNMATWFAKEYSSFDELIKNEPTCTRYYDGCNSGSIFDGQWMQTLMACDALWTYTCTSHEPIRYDSEVPANIENDAKQEKYPGVEPISLDVPTIGTQPLIPGVDDEAYACPMIYMPVCGEDGVTYGNTCSAGNKKIKYQGECVSAKLETRITQNFNRLIQSLPEKQQKPFAKEIVNAVEHAVTTKDMNHQIYSLYNLLGYLGKKVAGIFQ